MTDALPGVGFYGVSGSPYRRADDSSTIGPTGTSGVHLRWTLELSQARWVLTEQHAARLHGAAALNVVGIYTVTVHRNSGCRGKNKFY